MPPELAGERIFTLHFTKNDAAHSPVVVDFHVDPAASPGFVTVRYWTDVTRTTPAAAKVLGFTLSDARSYWKRYQSMGAVRIQN